MNLEEFHHALLRLSNEELQQMFYWVDALRPIERVDILMSEMKRRGLNVEEIITRVLRNKPHLIK